MGTMARCPADCEALELIKALTRRGPRIRRSGFHNTNVLQVRHVQDGADELIVQVEISSAVPAQHDCGIDVAVGIESFMSGNIGGYDTVAQRDFEQQQPRVRVDFSAANDALGFDPLAVLMKD